MSLPLPTTAIDAAHSNSWILWAFLPQPQPTRQLVQQRQYRAGNGYRRLQARSQPGENRRGTHPTDNRVLPQLTFALGRFATLQVAAIGLAMLGFSCCCDLVPLFHSLVGFLLGHDLQLNTICDSNLEGICLRYEPRQANRLPELYATAGSQ